jgi:glycerol-3-phosphate acyltransferase PlsY
MIVAALVLAAAYLLGSIPSSIIAGKLLRGYDFDIREHGSGNAGATNVARTLGAAPAFGVLLFDAGKGAAAAALPMMQWVQSHTSVDPLTLSLLAGMAAVVGHVFPLFAGFRGGKGVGTTAGFLLVLFPTAILACLVTWIVVLLLTGYVSVSSLIASAALPLALWLDPRRSSATAIVFGVVAALLILWLHRGNVRRLLQGTENRFDRARLFRRPAGERVRPGRRTPS